MQLLWVVPATSHANDALSPLVEKLFVCHQEDSWARVTSSKAVAADIAKKMLYYFLTADKGTLQWKIRWCNQSTAMAGQMRSYRLRHWKRIRTPSSHCVVLPRRLNLRAFNDQTPSLFNGVEHNVVINSSQIVSTPMSSEGSREIFAIVSQSNYLK